MFAHNAIKDLSKERQLTALGDNVIHHIKISTKYHFGDMLKNVYSLLEPMILKYEKETGLKFQPFKSCMEGVVVPFNTVWFEWTVPDGPDTPKCASLLIKNASFPHIITVYSFLFNKNYNSWVFLPILSTINMSLQNVAATWTLDRAQMKSMPAKTKKSLEQMAQYMMRCVNLGLLFINCRNVETCKRTPDEKLQKKRKKYGKQPMFTYHVLEIKDMRKKNIYPDDHTPTKMGKLRHHQMPARVAYYTAEKPLFGNPKLTGWYAFKSHWRGDPNKGTIIRDYETEKKGGN